MTTPAQQLSDLLASGLFSEDAAERKRTRAALGSHADPAVAAFFTADKRSYHTIRVGPKLVKVAREFVALGADGPRFALSLLKTFLAGSERYAYVLGEVLHVALAFPGTETEAFELLSGEKEVYLPGPKKALPPGLSRLRSLERLRIFEGTIKRADHIAELGQIPQPIRLELWVKDVDLTLFDGASHNIRGLFLRGSYSNFSDALPLRGWRHLEALNLEGTGVTDLRPLESLPLTELVLSETKVADLSPLASWPKLRWLGLRRIPAQDFSVLAGLTALEFLDLGFTSVRDLRLLQNLTALRSLALWGTPVDSLEPLVGLPLQELDLNYAPRPDLSPLIRIPTLESVHLAGIPDDAPGLAALIAARPDVTLHR